MTIKRTWTTNIPIFGNVRRERILEPGYTERYQRMIFDSDEHGAWFHDLPESYKVIDEDTIEHTYYDRYGEKVILRRILEKEEISERLNKKDGSRIDADFEAYRDSIKTTSFRLGIFDDDHFSLRWEPTLPSQAKK